MENASKETGGTWFFSSVNGNFKLMTLVLHFIGLIQLSLDLHPEEEEIQTKIVLRSLRFTKLNFIPCWLQYICILKLGSLVRGWFICKLWKIFLGGELISIVMSLLSPASGNQGVNEGSPSLFLSWSKMPVTHEVTGMVLSEMVRVRAHFPLRIAWILFKFAYLSSSLFNMVSFCKRKEKCITLKKKNPRKGGFRKSLAFITEYCVTTIVEVINTD